MFPGIGLQGRESAWPTFSATRQGPLWFFLLCQFHGELLSAFLKKGGDLGGGCVTARLGSPALFSLGIQKGGHLCRGTAWRRVQPACGLLVQPFEKGAPAVFSPRGCTDGCLAGPACQPFGPPPCWKIGVDFPLLPHRRCRCPSWRMSCWWVPSWPPGPVSRTKIWSAFIRVVMRWAIRMVVPCTLCWMDWRIFWSVSMSTAERNRRTP